MCGRYANHVTHLHGWDDILGSWPQDIDTGYNVSPTQTVPVFTRDQGAGMRWGMVAPWAKEISSKYPTFNARSETVAQKATFRNAYQKSQTCLVAALGYYEWIGPKGAKQPYFIVPLSGEPLVFAGLWECWRRDDLEVLSCTIITMPSTGDLQPLHPRMPVTLELEQAGRWLSEGTTHLVDLMEHQDTDRLHHFPVGKAVGNSRNQGAQLTEEITL